MIRKIIKHWLLFGLRRGYKRALSEGLRNEFAPTALRCANLSNVFVAAKADVRDLDYDQTKVSCPW